MIRCGTSRGSRFANLLIAGRQKYVTTSTSHEPKSKSKSVPVFSNALGMRQDAHIGESALNWRDEKPLEDLDGVHELLSSVFDIPINDQSEDGSQTETSVSTGGAMSLRNGPIMEEAAKEADGRNLVDGVQGDETTLKGKGVFKEQSVSLSEPPDLPMSPFMIPGYFDSKEKYHRAKAPPSKNPTAFQKQLSRNPYALALATPVRSCQLTKTNLPNFFLQDFSLMAHPDTDEPWWVPGKLTTKYRRTEPSTDEELSPNSSPGKVDVYPERNLVDTETRPSSLNEGLREPGLENTVSRDHTVKPTIPPALKPIDSQLSPTSTPRPATDIPKLGPTNWLLSRQGLIRAMQDPASGYGPEPWKRFSGVLQQSYLPRKIIQCANWRSDMDAFILELMRRRTREALEDLPALERGYVLGCNTWGQALKPGRQSAVILWTGPEISDGEIDDEAMPQVHGPPEFATVDIKPSDSKSPDARKRSKIPVHNLRRLLGRSHLQRLRAKCHIYNKELVILKDKRRVVDVLLRLWKLQGYMAHHEEFFTVDDAEHTLEVLMASNRALNSKAFRGSPKQKQTEDIVEAG